MKKKMAFVDLTNFKDWPMGGMLQYELAILNHLEEKYQLDIWGVSVDGVANKSIYINGKEYFINIWTDVKTKRKIIPNYYRGLLLRKMIRNFPKDYDVVYAHTGSCITALKGMIDRKKTKLVYHQHGLNHTKDYSLMSLIQRPFLYDAQKSADLIFVVSDPISVQNFSREMKGKTKAKIVAIGSPINLAKFDFIRTKNKIVSRKNISASKFIYTGRLSRFKDVQTLIESTKLYVDNVSNNAVLVIIGSGPEYDNLVSLAKNLGISENVQLLGSMPHEKVYEYLNDADMFLTASGGEGVSVSVLEAYASGLPVVCFKVPGLEGQIHDGITGKFAKEKSVESFYKAILELDDIRERCSLNCLEEAKKFDSKIVSDNISNEIEQLFF